MKNKEIADALGITTRQLTNLKKTEGFPVGGSMEQIKEWHENRKLSRNVSMEDLRRYKAQYEEERAKHEAVKRKLAEIELQKEKEGLVPISEAKRVIHESLAPVRTLLDSLPSRYCHAANPSDPALAQEVFQDALNSVYELIDRHSVNADT